MEPTALQLTQSLYHSYLPSLKNNCCYQNPSTAQCPRANKRSQMRDQKSEEAAQNKAEVWLQMVGHGGEQGAFHVVLQ